MLDLEIADYIRYVASLLFVLALIWAAGIILKKSLGHRFPAQKQKQNRLKILDVLPIDARNKLVTIEYKTEEFVLMLGHEHSLVVTSSFMRNTADSYAHNNQNPLTKEPSPKELDKMEPSL